MKLRSVVLKMILGVLAAAACSWPLLSRAELLTDMAREEFDKGPASLSSSSRSPFIQAARPVGEADVSTILVEGTLVGKGLHMALLSGQIVREGEKMGRYQVESVAPDRVELSFADSRHVLKMESYIAPLKQEKAGYSIEFRNASLRDTIRFLAKAANLNVIMPEDLSGRVTLSFNSIPVMEALRSILKVNSFQYASESGVIRIGKPEAFAGGTDLKTESFQLRYATARDMVDNIKLLLSDRGAIVSDDRTNTLTVKDQDAVVANIATLIGTVDRKDEQVQIEAQIVDANKSFSRSIGVQWSYTQSSGNVQVGGNTAVGTSGTTPNNPWNVNLGAGSPTSGLNMLIGRVFGGTIESQLSAAESKGDIKILSKPSVTTLNNMAAKIRSGTKIYVKSTSSINVGTSGGNAASAGTSGLQEIDTGIVLTVTPQISVDGYIKVKIEAVESEADFSRTVDGIPAVIDNTAETTVILKDGETAVIGGLYRQKTTKEKKGVPGLQSIPGVGLLFQSNTKTKADTELMIFITPKIIHS